MRTADDWAAQLTVAAPGMPALLIWPLARILSGRAGSDALLIVGDALEEAADEYQTLVDYQFTARNLRSLANVLRDEAPRRA